MSKEAASLKKRIEDLEAQITEAAEAPTAMETDALLEIAAAKIEGRQPLPWATEYMAYIKSCRPNYYF